ncbi:hypothetical protein PMAYCL1PPCAC_02618, partial [Pristionchus mayeri]
LTSSSQYHFGITAELLRSPQSDVPDFLLRPFHPSGQFDLPCGTLPQTPGRSTVPRTSLPVIAAHYVILAAHCLLPRPAIPQIDNHTVLFSR